MDALGTLRGVAGHIPPARSSTLDGKTLPRCRATAHARFTLRALSTVTLTMSFDDLRGSKPSTDIVDIELDVRILAALVEEGVETSADDSELLARLESADTMASGVETRLDDLLGTLDDLLSALEPKDSDNTQVDAIPQPERPTSEES